MLLWEYDSIKWKYYITYWYLSQRFFLFGFWKKESYIAMGKLFKGHQVRIVCIIGAIIEAIFIILVGVIYEDRI